MVLSFALDRSSPDRQLFFVTGGLLTRTRKTPTTRPRLEFRTMLDGTVVLAAITVGAAIDEDASESVQRCPRWWPSTRPAPA